MTKLVGVQSRQSIGLLSTLVINGQYAAEKLHLDVLSWLVVHTSSSPPTTEVSVYREGQLVGQLSALWVPRLQLHRIILPPFFFNFEQIVQRQSMALAYCSSPVYVFVLVGRSYFVRATSFSINM